MARVRIYDFSIVPSIGGNAIIVEYKNSRVLLDAGYSLSNFEASGEEEYLILLPSKDLVSRRILPDYVKVEKLLNDPGESQIFISHAHSDHYSLLYYLNLESKYCHTHIHCTRFTHRTIESAVEYYIREGIFYEYSDEVESRLRDISRRIRGTLNSRTIQNEISIDDFEVWTIKNEHSTIQSCGFIILAEDIIIFYTGDFKQYNSDVLAKLKEEDLWPPDVLITEGTRVNKIEPQTYVVEEEKDIVPRVHQFLKEKQKAYVVITVDPKNTIRIDNLLCSFEKNGIFLHPNVIRKYEIARELQQTNFVGKLNEIQDKLVPGMYLLPPFSSKATENFINQHRTKLKGNSLFILAEDIEHVVAGGVDYETFRSNLKNLSIPVYPVHASGHISMEKLVNFIRKDCQFPQLIIPVHTLNPDILKKKFNNKVFSPRENKRVKGEIELLRI